MPSCIPGCYGMIGVIQKKGSKYASNKILRATVITEEDSAKGKELRRRIYGGVGNSDIFQLMDHYFTELCMSLVAHLRHIKQILIIIKSCVLHYSYLGLSYFESKRKCL